MRSDSLGRLFLLQFGLIILVMEYLAAQKKKEEWGAKPCTHPRLEREYYSGAFLTNYVCVQCGEEFTIAQKMERDTLRRAKKSHHFTD